MDRSHSSLSILVTTVFYLTAICNEAFSQQNEECHRREESITGIIGNTVKLHSSLPRNYANHALLWIANNQDRITRCMGQNCDESNPGYERFHLHIGRGEDEVSMEIKDTSLRDSGIYSFEVHAEPVCVFLKVTVKVQYPAPTCETNLLQESGQMLLSCHWTQNANRVSFLSGDVTLFAYTSSHFTTDGSSVPNHSLSTNLPVGELFVADSTTTKRCVVTYQEEDSVSCEFQALSRVTTQLIREAENINFRVNCDLIDGENVLLWYSKDTGVLILEEERQSFLLQTRMISEKAILMCAAKSNGKFIPSDIVKLVMRSNFTYALSLNIRYLRDHFEISISACCLQDYRSVAHIDTRESLCSSSTVALTSTKEPQQTAEAVTNGSSHLKIIGLSASLALVVVMMSFFLILLGTRGRFRVTYYPVSTSVRFNRKDGGQPLTVIHASAERGVNQASQTRGLPLPPRSDCNFSSTESIPPPFTNGQPCQEWKDEDAVWTSADQVVTSGRLYETLERSGEHSCDWQCIDNEPVTARLMSHTYLRQEQLNKEDTADVEEPYEEPIKVGRVELFPLSPKLSNDFFLSSTSPAQLPSGYSRLFNIDGSKEVQWDEPSKSITLPSTLPLQTSSSEVDPQSLPLLWSPLSALPTEQPPLSPQLASSLPHLQPPLPPPSTSSASDCPGTSSQESMLYGQVASSGSTHSTDTPANTPLDNPPVDTSDEQGRSLYDRLTRLRYQNSNRRFSMLY